MPHEAGGQGVALDVAAADQEVAVFLYREALEAALVQRRPIVASTVGALPELIRHERPGLLFPPERAAELANAIDRYLCDRSFSELMAHNAHTAARSQYHTPHVMPRILQAYEDASDYFYQVRAARGIDTALQWRRAIRAAQNWAADQASDQGQIHCRPASRNVA